MAPTGVGNSGSLTGVGSNGFLLEPRSGRRMGEMARGGRTGEGAGGGEEEGRVLLEILVLVKVRGVEDKGSEVKMEVVFSLAIPAFSTFGLMGNVELSFSLTSKTNCISSTVDGERSNSSVS